MTDLSLVDPAWEMMDPNPNIWGLFADFDKRFFSGTLTSSFVELMWSTGRMTSTAGLCAWNPRTNFATIKLSKPLLQLRSRGDLVETLLHEMIHAYLFVTRQDDNHESHGPKFHMHMFRINKEAGTNITVYHTFHDEVKHYQQHIWRCDGPCAQRPPYYGYVRRASNRKPGSYDFWWVSHQANCSGTFNKISEPDKSVKPKQNTKSTSKSTVSALQNNKRIDDFFKTSSPSTSTSAISSSPPSSNSFKSPSKSNPVKPRSIKPSPIKPSPNKRSPIRNRDIRDYISPVKAAPTFPGKGHRLGSNIVSNPAKRLKLEDADSGEVSSSQDIKVAVPTQPLPILITQLVTNITDDEDSFTYDLPEIEFDDSIIVDSIKTGQSNVQSSDKSTNIVKVDSTSVPKVNEPSKKRQEEEDEEDVFTYELPNFTPFFGTGIKLGSGKSQPSTKGVSQNPLVIKLD